MAQTAGGTYYAASSELVSSWPATSLDLANQLESRFAARSLVTTTGLVLITNQSFSSAATINVNNCFSSSYRNYRVEVTGTCSTNVGYNLRLRVSGADATTNYKNRAIQNDGTITTVNAATTYIECGVASNAGFSGQFFISRPFVTETTMVSGQNAANDWGTFVSGHHNAATSYDGFTIYLTTGNISGAVKVYGLKD